MNDWNVVPLKVHPCRLKAPTVAISSEVL